MSVVLMFRLIGVYAETLYVIKASAFFQLSFNLLGDDRPFCSKTKCNTDFSHLCKFSQFLREKCFSLQRCWHVICLGWTKVLFSCREVLRTATCAADGPVTCFSIDKEWVRHSVLTINIGVIAVYSVVNVPGDNSLFFFDAQFD